jgi:hypothetical protein
MAPELDAFGKAYLQMTLEINKHQEGYVDAYFGPPEIKTEVESKEKKPLPVLLNDLSSLREQIPSDDPGRHTYLSVIMRSMDCTLRILNGEYFEFLDEVDRLYDITPKLVDDDEIEAAINHLDTVLPGSGSINDRLDKWRERFMIPNNKLNDLLELVHAETRKRTQDIIELVEGESVEFELVTDKPWAGYNHFLGNAKSRVTFNTDFPIFAPDLVELVAHESYPGHHTDLQLKEKHLYDERKLAEFASDILYAPSSVMGEAVAMTAVEIIFPGSTYYDWAAEVVIPAAGLPKVSSQELKRVGEICRNSLFYKIGVSFIAMDNAAIKYHSGELNEDQTVDYLQTYGLVAAKELAENLFQFIKLNRGYVFTYTSGYRLIEQAAKDDDKKSIFLHLLSNAVLPSQLADLKTH